MTWAKYSNTDSYLTPKIECSRFVLPILLLHSNILHPRIKVSSNWPPIIEYVVRRPYTLDRSWPSTRRQSLIGGNKQPVLLPQSHNNPVIRRPRYPASRADNLSWIVFIESSQSLNRWNVYSINPVDRAAILAEPSRVVLNCARSTTQQLVHTGSLQRRMACHLASVRAATGGLPSGESDEH